MPFPPLPFFIFFYFFKFHHFTMLWLILAHSVTAAGSHAVAMSRFVRASAYRHVYCDPPKAEDTYQVSDRAALVPFRIAVSAS